VSGLKEEEPGTREVVVGSASSGVVFLGKMRVREM
jgi:hypothetical protein